MLRRWTDIMVAFDDPDAGPEEAASFVAAIKQMFTCASGKTTEKRTKLSNDVWSLVANAEVDGEQLSQGQLDRFFQLLMVAGPSLLFFGCRYEQQDFIYADELRTFASAGVAELHLAFSRMQPEKICVQDAIRKARDRVWSLIEDDGIIYVCGDASRMEPDVRKTLIGILQDKSGVDASDATRRSISLSPRAAIASTSGHRARAGWV